MNAHIVKDALLGLEDLGSRLVDAVDACEGPLVIVGPHIGIDQVVLHIIFITRVGVLVDKVLEQVHALVKRGARTLAHADGIVIIGRLSHAPVTVHHCSLLECHVGAVQVVELALGLSQIQVGTLSQGIATVGHIQHVVHHGLVVAVAVVEHTHGIGRGAVGLALGVVEVATQIGAGLTVIALMVVALTHNAVKLGVKVVITMLVEQRTTVGNYIVIMFLVIFNLSKIVSRLEAQLGAFGDATEFVGSLVIVTLGIVQISLVELTGTGIACALVQLVVLALGLTVVA